MRRNEKDWSVLELSELRSRLIDEKSTRGGQVTSSLGLRS